MRVLSCVPEQRFSFKAKVQWMDSIAKEHKPDLFVTPQEYFGGIQNLYFEQAAGEKVAYAEEEISKPTVGNSQSTTSTTTEIFTTHDRVDLVPAILSMIRPPQRISRRALRTFQTRIGITNSMITMAAADPPPQSLARNSLSYM